jgi:hypothetical protein
LVLDNRGKALDAVGGFEDFEAVAEQRRAYLMPHGGGVIDDQDLLIHEAFS